MSAFPGLINTQISGVFRRQPEDFDVTEHLSFKPSGDGEHCFLYIEKRSANTAWVAEQLAKQFAVKLFAVSYAGLKDRHAVTRQWFSVHIPGQPNPESLIEHPEYKVLTMDRNNKKLKSGSIESNRFKLILRDLNDPQEDVEVALESIRQQGFANYFGDQRFGHGGKNVEKAVALLQGKLRVKRHQKSIFLSALRSWFFNQYLGKRIQHNNWNTPAQSDRIILGNGRSHFEFDCDDPTIEPRLSAGELHIAGPLPGSDFLNSSQISEHSLPQLWQEYYPWLELLDVNTDWRALRVVPSEMQWEWLDKDVLQLNFGLRSGSYATELLAELGQFQDGSVRPRSRDDS